MATPMLATTIREGHERLLDTLRDFDVAGHLAGDRDTDPAVLRGAAAFLRQEILPFSRWEERALGGDDDIAFEHAFLAAEIDAFARAVDALERALSGDARREATAELLRRLHRIEAVLELHTIRDDDEPGGRP